MEMDWPLSDEKVASMITDWIKPLLRKYNQQHRRRVRVHSRRIRERKLPPKARKFFDRFARMAAISFSHHPNDWERVYEFVLQLRKADHYPPGLIRSLLIDVGVESRHADSIAETFEHLAAFKAYLRKRRQGTTGGSD